ncbi:hypothetical protein GYMLUDRAFT_364188 [Collybiopsis luxurians FD-317 M1]|nr:hypothetical protein GYMLUDRAFT_364188 [Collybiopsis luxurians FD-317 M1]
MDPNRTQLDVFIFPIFSMLFVTFSNFLVPPYRGSSRSISESGLNHSYDMMITRVNCICALCFERVWLFSPLSG